jgi:predicted DNA-binding transcriptional regulator YafY
MSAHEQLARILYILPAAAREDGIGLNELAHALGVDRKTVIADLEKVTTRAFYHPAASVDPFIVLIEDDRVWVDAIDEFKRPARLTPREALALGLGLRTLAAEEEEPARAEVLALAERLEHELTAAPVELRPRVQETQAEVDQESLEQEQLYIALGDDDARGRLAGAIEHKRVCMLHYLKGGDTFPLQRRVAPRKLIYANGRWYVAAFDYDRDAMRLFRLDRIIEVDVLPQSFDESALPAEQDERHQIFAADQDAEQEVSVRYSNRIARWITENVATEPLPDGSIRVRHQVADSRWLIRHVLKYGGEAVVETEPYRQMVAEAAERFTL